MNALNQLFLPHIRTHTVTIPLSNAHLGGDIRHLLPTHRELIPIAQSLFQGVQFVKASECAMGDDAYPVAQCFRLLHKVSRKQDSGVLLTLQQDLPYVPAMQGVQTRRRLIQYHHCWITQQCYRNRQSPLHPPRQTPYRCVPFLIEIHTPQYPLHSHIHSLQQHVECEVLSWGQIHPLSIELRTHSQCTVGLLTPYLCLPYPPFPRRCKYCPRNHGKQSCLPCPVSTQQPCYFIPLETHGQWLDSLISVRIHFAHTHHSKWLSLCCVFRVQSMCLNRWVDTCITWHIECSALLLIRRQQFVPSDPLIIETGDLFVASREEDPRSKDQPPSVHGKETRVHFRRRGSHAAINACAGDAKEIEDARECEGRKCFEEERHGYWVRVYCRGQDGTKHSGEDREDVAKDGGCTCSRHQLMDHEKESHERQSPPQSQLHEQ